MGAEGTWLTVSTHRSTNPRSPGWPVRVRAPGAAQMPWPSWEDTRPNVGLSSRCPGDPLLRTAPPVAPACGDGLRGWIRWR
ncbi:hypothetical protein DB32_004770 [Sandaracinus amylolyticus]|uniref:Uncharacterized protein n=1 Tax=Sandaracinus amylolyticus TaxID=927083 RepID=A0A0F6W589_9BACT|nr:hypothetical protein DB32_004770 [Sandaracinus amylolyticus]